jgi:hypothetical protein
MQLCKIPDRRPAGKEFLENEGRLMAGNFCSTDLTSIDWVWSAPARLDFPA